MKQLFYLTALSLCLFSLGYANEKGNGMIIDDPIGPFSAQFNDIETAISKVTQEPYEYKDKVLILKKNFIYDLSHGLKISRRRINPSREWEKTLAEKYELRTPFVDEIVKYYINNRLSEDEVIFVFNDFINEYI